MKKNSQIHFYIETSVLNDLKMQADREDITLSKLCMEKLRDYIILSRIYDTLNHINEKISKEEKILGLLRVSLKERG